MKTASRILVAGMLSLIVAGTSAVAADGAVCPRQRGDCPNCPGCPIAQADNSKDSNNQPGQSNAQAKRERKRDGTGNGPRQDRKRDGSCQQQ